MYLRDTSKINHVIHVDTFLFKEKNKSKKNERKKSQKPQIKKKNTIKVLFIFFLNEILYIHILISEMQSQCRNGKRPNAKRHNNNNTNI